MEELKGSLYKLYDKTSYLDMFGGSVFMVLFTLLVFFVLFSYFSVMNNIKPIKKNWSTQRCNPSVIPFVGFINKPLNKSIFAFTGENFNYCINNILASIANKFIEPIHYLLHALQSTIYGLINTVQTIRKKFSSLIHNIETIDQEIMGRILNFLMPIRKMLMKFKTILEKVNASLVTTLYTVLTGYFGLKAFLGAFVKIMLGGLGILTGIIVPLLFFIFTAPLAAPLLVIYGIIAAFLTTIIVGLEDIIHMNASAVPAKPHCFHKDTKIRMRDGLYKKIKDITPGELLQDDNKVTACFKVKKFDDMYDYNGVIVSGCHNVFHEGLWKEVKTLRGSKKIKNSVFGDNSDILYCLNTSSKFIIINDVIFSDWDDIDNDEMNKIYSNYNRKNKCNFSRNRCKSVDDNQYFTKFDLTHKFEKSFTYCEKIKLYNGKYVNISDIEIGDILWSINKESKNEVIGLVKALRRNINNVNKIEITYNLLTTEGVFIISDNGDINKKENVIVGDYNRALEKYI